MDFVKSHFGKRNLWPVEHFFEHICLLGGCNSKHTQKWWQICSKSVQLVRGSFFRSDFLQNPYFKGGAAHLSGKIVMHDQIKTIDGEDMETLTSMHANTLKRDHPHIMSAFFWTFSDYIHYMSINTVLNVSINCHFLNSTTQSFSWRYIGMVSKDLLGIKKGGF